MMKTHIVVHHSLTEDGAAVSWGAIEKYHRETQGWRDIGYHAGVELVGDHYYALIGRPEQSVAAAVKEGGMNAAGLHVCCVGNYDLVPPPLAMLDTLIRRVVLPWMDRYHIQPENVVAHRDFATYKSCPGAMFDMDLLRRMVR